jgi:glycosyltransferase involved in cell wall biosynthesis
MLDTGSPEPSENRGLAKDGNVVRFLYAGRLERRKGLELSLRALSLARSGGVANWEFEILGDGPDSLRLLQLAQELGIGNQVRFAGAVERNMVFERMRCADVFYFTSVRDTSGGVNLEAMAMGLPVLCLAHQGVGDITDDTCAIRVLPGDIEITIQRLAEGVKTLCADAGLRENLGAAAKERALRCFQWDQKFECMLRHYTFVMTGRD